MVGLGVDDPNAIMAGYDYRTREIEDRRRYIVTKFVIGKTYKHTAGKILTIVGVVSSEAYGLTLIGEDSKGSFYPIGEDHDNVVNWEEVQNTLYTHAEEFSNK